MSKSGPEGKLPQLPLLTGLTLDTSIIKSGELAAFWGEDQPFIAYSSKFEGNAPKYTPPKTPTAGFRLMAPATARILMSAYNPDAPTDPNVFYVRALKTLTETVRLQNPNIFAAVTGIQGGAGERNPESLVAGSDYCVIVPEEYTGAKPKKYFGFDVLNIILVGQYNQFYTFLSGTDTLAFNDAYYEWKRFLLEQERNFIRHRIIIYQVSEYFAVNDEITGHLVAQSKKQIDAILADLSKSNYDYTYNGFIRADTALKVLTNVILKAFQYQPQS